METKKIEIYNQIKKKYIAPNITIFEMGEPVLAATSPSENPRMEVGVDDWIDDEELNSTKAKHFFHVWEDENKINRSRRDL